MLLLADLLLFPRLIGVLVGNCQIKRLREYWLPLGLSLGLSCYLVLFYICLHPIAFSHYSPSKTADQGYQEDSNKKDVIGHSKCRKFQ